jgi:rod shape-determining protein MreC
MFDRLRSNHLAHVGIVFLISISCFWFEKKNGISTFKTGLIQLIAPIQHMSSYLGSEIRSFFDHYIFLIDTQAEYQRVVEENEKLKNRLIDYEQLKSEQKQLKRMLGLKDDQIEMPIHPTNAIIQAPINSATKPSIKMIPAKVISRQKNELLQNIRLFLEISTQSESQSETQSEIQINMPIVAQGHLIGKIQKIHQNYIEVMLLSDIRSSIHVVLEHSQVEGLILGQGANQPYLGKFNDIQQNRQMVIGERVLSTGDDGIFPKGFLVGVVTEKIPRTQGLFNESRVESLLNLNALDWVWIVVDHSKFQFKDQIEKIFPLEDKK